MAAIIVGGMQLPDSTMLARRIDALRGVGLLTEAIAESLKAENLAHEQSRAGMVWFCFFPPRVGGESGIRRFFRFWGGRTTRRTPSPLLRGEEDVVASGRAADREDPKKSKRKAAHSLDKDPISELHQGQRSDAP
jgi:hypothetical protein